MKTRLTPLNVVSAALLVALLYPLVHAGSSEKLLSTVLLLILVIICAVADIVFRGFLRDLKRIWIVETIFVIFVAILLLIFRAAGS
ncbi:hypothetical protein BDE36_1570 [Arcticibacter tournemirensis]|uniref:Sulfate exporter family transporter n=1 Tax=Arcticibacter tournemirensis TaxID=699437 RepID=A0A4Q0MAF7_9SPHI|nr:hypothetical protein [Arcticibacter tournemirensis]KAA8484400.1 hypothetical protein F1649_06405 [Arcticibacter tournemirensis]RXF69789.1 hypothetical protein EKH83_11100 [Arcticibacter tournemirensis]TQM49842.1 hypothetical protein BDE36_1570 [Arcticibacter tournemirensis]